MTYSVDKHHAPITLPEAEGRIVSIKLIPYSIEASVLERETTSYMYHELSRNHPLEKPDTVQGSLDM